MAPVNKLELKGGDKLLVKPGTIVGSLAPKVKGGEKKPVVVKFAPGTYEWQAEGLNEERLHISNTNDAPDMPKRVMIDLHGARHLEVRGKDALLLCSGRMMEIHMDQCRDVTFKDNVFVRSHMSAILVADDARSWYESGLVRKLTIEGNTFDHCGGPVVNVAPENREHAQAVHSGISILNNKFLMDNKNGVSLKSAANVLIQGNTFSNGTPQENVRQNNCTDVTVK